MEKRETFFRTLLNLYLVADALPRQPSLEDDPDKPVPAVLLGHIAFDFLSRRAFPHHVLPHQLDRPFFGGHAIWLYDEVVAFHRMSAYPEVRDYGFHNNPDFRLL